LRKAVIPEINDHQPDRWIVCHGQQKTLTNGIHQDILTQVSRISALKVISRLSTLGYRDTTKDVRTIGIELGVATILEGSVQQAADRIRINVQLIDAINDTHLWAQTYDRELTARNIFLIQSEIATDIATELQARLEPDEVRMLNAVPTENLAALESYFQGRQSMEKRTKATLDQAFEYFSNAIELDPQFALAYVGLAETYALQSVYAGRPAAETLDVIEVWIQMALELDSQSGEALTSLGFLHQNKRNYAEAEAAYNRALQLNPNYVPAHHWYSTYLRQLGRYEEGLEQITKALQLDPLSQILQTNLATVLLETGRPREALDQYLKTLDIDSSYPAPYSAIGGLNWTLFGQLDEAVTWFKNGIKLDANDSNVMAGLGLVYLDLGDEAMAEQWITRALELGPQSVIPNWAMEMLLIYQGRPDKAIDQANKVLHQNPGWVLSLANLRNRDMEAGRASDAYARYKKHFPELFGNSPEIHRANVDAAIDLVPVMTRLEHTEHANMLLDKSVEYAKSTTMPRLRWFAKAYGVPELVSIYALKGEKEMALEALTKAVDEGWRGLWWYWLDHDPNLGSIRDEPEFQAARDRIRIDMAAQLARTGIQ
jgi:TolB-like protein/Tfp pilus assembly protein PilF